MVLCSMLYAFLCFTYALSEFPINLIFRRLVSAGFVYVVSTQVNISAPFFLCFHHHHARYLAHPPLATTQARHLARLPQLRTLWVRVVNCYPY